MGRLCIPWPLHFFPRRSMPPSLAAPTTGRSWKPATPSNRRVELQWEQRKRSVQTCFDDVTLRVQKRTRYPHMPKNHPCHTRMLCLCSATLCHLRAPRLCIESQRDRGARQFVGDTPCRSSRVLFVVRTILRLEAERVEALAIDLSCAEKRLQLEAQHVRRHRQATLRRRASVSQRTGQRMQGFRELPTAQPYC